MKKRLALISEQASPLAATGGNNGSSQSVYVARLAKYLAKQRYAVDVFTRKESADQADIFNWLPDVRVIHIQTAGFDVLDDTNRIGFMGEFTNNLLSFIRKEHIVYDIMHASGFTSALVASNIKKYLNIPYVVTFSCIGTCTPYVPYGKR